MSDLVQALSNLNKAEAQIIWGVVDSVNESEETCAVTADGLQYEEVLLSISASGVVAIPEPNTKVLIAFIEHSTNAFVIKAESVSAYIFRTEESKIRIKPDGLLLESQGENLQTVLTDFVSEVAKIIVIQGTSPSVPALEAIKTRIKKLLKDA